jgi:hypothetical protein
VLSSKTECLALVRGKSGTSRPSSQRIHVLINE